MNNDSLILPHHPECMSPEVLTKLLVQHPKLHQQIVSGFVNGLRSGDRLHVLLVGASGIGKTHIVSLICHRLSRQPDLQHITNALPPADAATAILHRIVQQLQHRSLLLVHENLHLLFHSLTDAEQKHWRAFLQETRRFSTLATAPALFPQISDRNRPCFGFFDIHHLQSLKLAASRQLVLRICRLRKRKNALQILNSPAGLARLQAADLLLAGNPRAWVLFAQALTTRTLREFTSLLEQTLDTLTPACLGKLHNLSPQQQQLLLGLCDQSGAKTVQQLAVATGVDERCCSRQLGYLRALAFVPAIKFGKESC
ncbi:MAG: hypothetical protein ACK56U_21890 [Planctomyces sp.]